MRPGLKWALLAISVLCIAALVWHFRGPSPTTASDTTAQAVSPTTDAPSTTKPIVSRPAPPSTVVPTTPAPSQSPITPSSPVAAPAIPVDPAMGALVAGLKQLSGTNVALTAEAVAAWRTNLMQLVQAGPAAVPALRAFLDQKSDSSFSREALQALGYGSAREAAIDALRQIGGPESIAAMEGLLGTTKTPREVALLARNLEETQPGNYREQALSAARTGLQAAQQSPNANVDVAPLFEIFQHYGDASAIQDLERARSPWNYYATIALADLPDGAGIPSILRMAEGSAGSRVLALEMVAQLAPNNAAAREFLLAQASGNNIPANLWPYLTGPLAGDQYFAVDSAITQYPQVQSWSDIKTTRISSGNQNLYMLPGYLSLTPDELTARTALVDQLLQSATDPAAVQALQRARDTLARRSTTATAPTTGTGTGRGQ